jgi:hypothetical protein
VLFDEEGQAGDFSGKVGGSDVDGVSVSEGADDVTDFPIEGVVVKGAESLLQAAELLNRVYAVHRPFQRKVGVQAFEDTDECVHHLCGVGG